MGSSSSRRNRSVNEYLFVYKQFRRLIIEQQYQQAVALIKRTLAFLDSIKNLGVESSNSSTRDTGIRAQVQKRSLQLAEILRDSLVRLPNSQVE